VGAGLTGYLSSVRDLLKSADKWKAGGVPLTMMMNLERRHGKDKPVILKALVELKGKPSRLLPLNGKNGRSKMIIKARGLFNFGVRPK